MRLLIFSTSLLLTGAVSLEAAPVKTLADKSIDPLKGATPIVMFFTTNDCPVANKMVPEIRRISDE